MKFSPYLLHFAWGYKYSLSIYSLLSISSRHGGEESYKMWVQNDLLGLGTSYVVKAFC